MPCRWGLLALVALLPLAAGAKIRGLDPALAPRYQPGADGQFACLDGKKSVPFEQVNDDYCDCSDGSDEPGTSACPNGHFYCANKYFVPLRLNASMVDDGVCDCCDGSDEPEGRCPNTCYEKGAESMIDLKEKVATAKKGVAGRDAYIQDAEVLKAQWEKRRQDVEGELEQARKEKEAADAERSRLEEQQSKLQARKREFEEQKNKLVEHAAPAKPAEQAAEGGEEGQAAEGGEEGQDAGEAADADAGGDAADAAEWEQPGEEGGAEEAEQVEAEEAVKSEEELARERMAQWIPGAKDAATGAEAEEEAEAAVEDIPAYDGVDDVAAEEEEQQQQAEGQEEEEEEEEEQQQFFHDHEDTADAADGADGAGAGDGGDDTASGASAHAEEGAGTAGGAAEEGQPASTIGKAKKLLNKVFGALTGHKDQDLPKELAGPIAELDAEISKLDAQLSSLDKELQPARSRSSEAQSKQSRLEQEQRDLDEKLAGGYGEEDAFAPLVGKCFSAKVDKYTYEVCPFGKASQKEGHSSTSLGSWAGLEQSDSVMAFRNGQSCWQGPSRSMTVTLRCGQQEKLRKVEEPSRCEYTAELETPAACTREALAAFEAELAARERLLFGTGEEEEDAGAAAGRDEL